MEIAVHGKRIDGRAYIDVNDLILYVLSAEGPALDKEQLAKDLQEWAEKGK